MEIKIENRKTEKSIKPKLFLWKDQQYQQTFSYTDKEKWENMQITKMRNESENITFDIAEIKRIIKEYYEHGMLKIK